MKYRVNIGQNAIGTKYYIVEVKKGYFSRWNYVNHSLQFKLKEAIATKVLLENGHSCIDYFKASCRCESLNLPIE